MAIPELMKLVPAMTTALMVGIETNYHYQGELLNLVEISLQRCFPSSEYDHRKSRTNMRVDVSTSSSFPSLSPFQLR